MVFPTLVCLMLCQACQAQEKGVARYPEKRLSTVLGRADPDDLALAFEVHWERETHRLRRICSSTDREVAAITAKILPIMKATAKQVAAEDTNKYYDYTYGLFAMRREFEQAIKAILQNSLGTGKFDAFEEDLEARRTMRKAWIVGSVASTINGSVALDEDQLKKTLATLNDQFRVTWAMTALNYRPFDQVDPALDTTVRSFLTKDQLKAWDASAKYLFESYPVKSADETAAMETFRRDLRICIEAHVDTLSRTLELDERQLRKLKILAKGIEGELYERRLRARLKYADPTVKVVTPATSSDAKNAPGTMLVAHPRWQAHVINVLNEDQKKTFLKWQASRRVRHIDRLAGTMIRRLNSNIGMTSGQASALRAAVDSSFPPDTSEPSIHGRLGIAIGAIPPAKIGRILGPEEIGAWQGVYKGFQRDVRPNRDD
jgi:hypothetical protein